MGVPGRIWEAVTVPRWLVVLVGFVLFLVGAGFSLGIRYAVADHRVTALVMNDSVLNADHQRLEHRVDTMAIRIDSLYNGRSVDSRLLRSLARLRCLDNTSAALRQAAELPCVALLSSAGR